jgi:hypothetical protein
MTWNKCRIFSENHELLILYDIYNSVYIYTHYILSYIYIHIIYIIYVYDVYMCIYIIWLLCILPSLRFSGQNSDCFRCNSKPSDVDLHRILYIWFKLPYLDPPDILDFPQPFSPERGLEGGQWEDYGPATCHGVSAFTTGGDVWWGIVFSGSTLHPFFSF